MTEYRPCEENVKITGRYLWFRDILWLTYSASGIDFYTDASECEIELMGDAGAAGPAFLPRYAIELNGVVTEKGLVEGKNRVKVFTKASHERHVSHVRLIKLSESSESSLGINYIAISDDCAVKGRGVWPAEPTEHRIEFIGDSITCGYGIDGREGETFTTGNENSMKAYSFVTAELLGADYSMVSRSGHGIISGYTGDGVINDKAVMQRCYDKCGVTGGRIEGVIDPQEVEWEFAKFVPDVIVMNLGTNDASYCKEDNDKSMSYRREYTAFLKHVREQNRNAAIVCTLGVMGTSLNSYAEAAVADYTAESHDDRIVFLPLEEQRADEDGIALDGHPSAATHRKLGEKLAAFIKSRVLTMTCIMVMMIFGLCACSRNSGTGTIKQEPEGTKEVLTANVQQTDEGLGKDVSNHDDTASDTSIPDQVEVQGVPGELTFSHTSGSYTESIQLMLNAGGSTIYYTTDGSDPGTSDTRSVYKTKIAVSDRSNDKNYVSAVDPMLFDAANVDVNKTKDGFSCKAY